MTRLPISDVRPAAEEAAGPWYLVYTKPRQEHVALADLQQGFEAYLPLYKTFKKSPSVEGSAVIVFEQARNQADPASLSAFQPGCQVRLSGGALKGLVGIVQPVLARRVALLLELLGGPRRIEVARQALALV